jgi:apolipoprotein N-acyltransferase
MGEMMGLRATDEAAFRERTRAQHAAYLEQTVRAAETDAQIVLWPELAGLGMADDVEQLVASGQALADEHDLYLAMPLYVIDPAGEALSVNKIVVADPEGAIVLEHVKYGGNILEGSQPGSRELQTVETPFGTLSAVICWDTDYPSVMRQAGAQNVDILLSPAWVWPDVAAIHAEMATFRSIENGVTVVRQSDNGFSLVSDPYGRVVAQENHVGQEGAMMTALAPVMPTGTLYPIVGDIVGQLSVVGLMLAIVAVVAQRFLRARRERQPMTAEVA